MNAGEKDVDGRTERRVALPCEIDFACDFSYLLTLKLRSI